MTDIDFTNEMLEKILGGASNVKVYSFTGAYAEELADDIENEETECACGCFCSGGSGNGGGSGH